MTFAMGGGIGSPKSRGKEHNQLICDSEKGGEVVKKSQNCAAFSTHSMAEERAATKVGSNTFLS